MTLDVPQPIDLSDHLGPVSFVAIEFEQSAVHSEGFAKLVDLVDRGLIIVLDLEFVRRTVDGTLASVPPGSLDVGFDLSAFEGANSGLLDHDDLELVAHDLGTGSVMVVLVYEELVMEPVLRAWADGGGKVVAEGPVDVVDLEQALDAPQEG